MRLRVILFALALAVAVIPTLALGAAEKGSLHATMSGKVEVPKGDPDGTGTAEIKITGRKVCWELKTAKIAKPNAAHIHKGKAGKAGPVVVPFGATYKAKGCTTTSMANANAISATPGSFYVNIHNAKYPGGAVRGQLRK
jgi:CHRD domain